MNHCEYCGSIIPENAKFCSNCGAAVEESSTTHDKSSSQAYYRVDIETPYPKKKDFKLLTTLKTVLKIIAAVILMYFISFIVYDLIDSDIVGAIVKFLLYVIIIYYFFIHSYLIAAIRKKKAKRRE